MFSDLATIPGLLPYFKKLSKEQCKEGFVYIKNILQKCHKEGHSQILFYNDEEKLMGYAILFIDPSLKNSAYLHKVYVNEENRHNGIGTKFLNSLNNSDYTISLLSPPDKIPFFFRKR